MSNADFIVEEFQMEYTSLTTKIKKQSEMVYDIGILYCYILELKSGYKVKKVLKTTSRSTKVNYVRIKDEKDCSEYIEKLHNMKQDIIDKYGEVLGQ